MPKDIQKQRATAKPCRQCEKPSTQRVTRSKSQAAKSEEETKYVSGELPDGAHLTDYYKRSKDNGGRYWKENANISFLLDDKTFGCI